MSHKLTQHGWVGFDLVSSGTYLILLRLMRILLKLMRILLRLMRFGHKWLSNWARCRRRHHSRLRRRGQVDDLGLADGVGRALQSLRLTVHLKERNSHRLSLSSFA